MITGIDISQVEDRTCIAFYDKDDGSLIDIVEVKGPQKNPALCTEDEALEIPDCPFELSKVSFGRGIGGYFYRFYCMDGIWFKMRQM